MKKLFVCAMALAAFVSCSKDDVADPALTSKMKSVTITIQNSEMNPTRAKVSGGTIDVTAEGGEAGESLLVNNNELAASANQLTILFANAQGLILKAMPLVKPADGTATNHPTSNDTSDYTYGETLANAPAYQQYTYHHVPEQVTRIAVVRLQEKDPAITENSTNLSYVLALAQDESLNLQRGVQEIILYAEDNLVKASEDPTLCWTDPNTGLKYYYYTATLTVEPQVARVELIGVTCRDLGDLNIDLIEGTENPNIETQGLDELTIKKFYFNNYTKTWTANNVLYGSYCPTACKHEMKKGIAPVSGSAWSWNIAEQEVPQMTLELDAVAHDWTVNNPGKTVTVVGLKDNEELTEANVSTFQKGHVYRLDLNFSEANIDATDDALCVIATVEVKTWTVVPVYPVFGQKGSSNAQ